MLIGAVNPVDQEDATPALQRLILCALLQQAHLRNGDLAQRAFGGKGDEVRVRGEQQGIVIALFGGQLFAVRHELNVGFTAEVILLNPRTIAQETAGEPPGERGFADAAGAMQHQRLRQLVLLNHSLDSRDDGRVTVEIPIVFVVHGHNFSTQGHSAAATVSMSCAPSITRTRSGSEAAN